MKLVFVSSTFKDMQYERDLLQTYAIPVLDRSLREYGENVYFGDLRWGVNTTDLDSDEGSKKVLQVCLDQIDNCKPYMIVLIGERYGWIPAQSLIDEACVLKGIDKIRDISVTELEIDYGALLNPEYEGRILFYFRDLDTTGMTDVERADYQAESPVHQEKVASLKCRIEKIYPDHIRHYTARWDPAEKRVVGLEGFLTQVQNDLGEVLMRDLRALEEIPWQERCMQAADKWFCEKAKYQVDDTDMQERYSGSYTGNGSAFTFFIGRDGEDAGAQLFADYCETEGHKLAFCFGLDKLSDDYMALTRVIAYKMEEILGVAHQDMEDHETAMDCMVTYISIMQNKGEQLCIFADNCGEDAVMFLSLLERRCIEHFGAAGTMMLPGVIRMEMAMQSDLPFYPFFPLSKVYDLAELTPVRAAEVLDSVIRSNHKEIAQVVKDRILAKKHSTHASYLRSIVKRLLILDSEDFAAIRAMGDGMDNINRYMLALVDETSDDRYGILLELINEAKQRIDTLFVDRMISVFSHAVIGLTMDEVKALFAYFGWAYSDLNFALATRMLEDVLVPDPMGRYRIKNRQIEAMLREAAAPMDIQKLAEFMLGHEELRTSAVAPAIFSDDMDFLYSVIMRSGVTTIANRIRYLIERGYEERAVDIIVALSYREGMVHIGMVPEMTDFTLAFLRTPKDHPVCPFYNLLAYKACAKIGLLGRSVKDGPPEMKHFGDKILLEFSLQAELMFAEEMIEDQPEVALHSINTAIFHLQQLDMYYNYQTINRLCFVMLKCLRYIGSAELIEKQIGQIDFLENFVYKTPYEKLILKKKVYYEYCKCMEIAERDEELCERLMDEVSALASDFASEDVFDDMIEEDYLYLAEITGEYNFFYSICRFLYPQSLKLIQAETQGAENCVYYSDEEFFEEKQLLFEYDLVYKAKSLMQFKANKVNSCAYLNALSSYLFDVEFGDEECDLVQEYFDCLAFSCEYEENMLLWEQKRREELQNDSTALQQEERILKRLRYGVDVMTYIGLLDVCAALKREGYASIIEIGLKMVRRQDPLCQVVWGLAESLYLTESDEQLDAAYQRYMSIRDGYLGIDKQAILALDQIFTDEGYETPTGVAEE